MPETMDQIILTNGYFSITVGSCCTGNLNNHSCLAHDFIKKDPKQPTCTNEGFLLVASKVYLKIVANNVKKICCSACSQSNAIQK
jgi:hypothetical protein